ncbi:phage replisome organizer N-terminal domain-containing protein [Ruminococcus sp. CAG:330]|uniref:phage replisome organizer N-terminal domain-containing protein n=1 Tax=Ruminococcus sp. CAG:330 TaxID=1262954 RepID=UPI00033F4DD8|nr:phage replisome organizer N-terminal domain-containing protein [Ruminococcus sp. CAG:330]CDE12125.1 putative uncharacterized protein [Ruminococcus sp. CAG:330]
MKIVAQSQKYYWLKLKNDFFDDDAISWMEEQEHGAEYVLFYLKLCLKSLKTDGILIRNVGDLLIPYDTKKLAEITRTKFDTVVVAMEILKKIGLIEILENGELYLKQVQSLTGSETTKAELMRKSRERKRLESTETACISDGGNNVTTELPTDGKNVDTEIEIEIRDRDRVRDRNKKTPTESKNVSYQEIADMYHDICTSYPRLRGMSDRRKKAIKARMRTHSLEDFRQLFEKAEASSFLKGSNNRDWSADFDWMMRDGNFDKIMEGKYDDKPEGGEHNGTDSSIPAACYDGTI